MFYNLKNNNFSKSLAKLSKMILPAFVGLAVCLILVSNISAYENFHGNSSIPKLNYDSLYNVAVDFETSEMGKTVLESCLSTYGGVDKLKELKSVKYEWLMNSTMSKDTVTIIKSAAEGRKYSIEKRLSDRFEKRMINGDKAWFQTGDTLIELDKSRYKSELFSCLVLQMPYAAVSEPFSEIKYGQREGDSLHYFYFKKPDSLMIVIGISPDTYFIKTAEGIISQDEQNFVFINKFMDHKRINGYLFPHALTNISMWLTVGQSVLKDITINEPFEKNYFYPDKKRDPNKAH